MNLLGTNIVILNGKVHNGSEFHAGIIVRDWLISTEQPEGAIGYVNVMVLPDCGTPYCETSIHCFSLEEEAIRYRDKFRNQGGLPAVSWLADEPSLGDIYD